MRETLLSEYGGLGIVLGAGVIIFLLFIVLRFFRILFSLSFIGFLGSIFSYFVYDYIFIKVPLIASISLVLCLTGFSKSSIIGKIFSVIGSILSVYIIIHTFGLI